MMMKQRLSNHKLGSRLTSSLCPLYGCRSDHGHIRMKPGSILAIFGLYQWLLCSLLSVHIDPVAAGFWTFYMPNFMKPSGYSEVNDLLYMIETEMNKTKDNYADVNYFWKQMKLIDEMNQPEVYQCQSVCEEVLPLFRDLAIRYTEIDYEHFMKPMESYHEHLTEFRSKYYPEGSKPKTILPRAWEQNLYETELQMKIDSFTKLANEPELRELRKRMIVIWTNVKRGLDHSVKCLYLKYAYMQMAQDINQLALDFNVKSMQQAMDLLKSAYKRIDKYKPSDTAAIEAIEESVKRELKKDNQE